MTPLVHQNSPVLTETRVRRIKPWSRARKLSDGAGLYLLVVPTGGKYWRFNYRFGGEHKTLALGVYPDVLLDKARERHRAARQLLAAGIDPSPHRRVLRSRTAIDRVCGIIDGDKYKGPVG